MKNLVLFPLLLIIYSQTLAQITFEKGYFIDNEGSRTECLIKNKDWGNNPNKFTYSSSSKSQEKKIASLDSVKEFGIYDFSRYVRRTVQVDTSSEHLSSMSLERAPQFETRTLFLKVLVSGQASLLGYRDKNLLRFFFKMEDGELEPLIYKPYKTRQSKFKWNERFRQQLYGQLKCPDISETVFQKTDYNQRELIALFVRYNTCVNAEHTNYEARGKRDAFDLNLRVGSTYSDITFSRDIGTFAPSIQEYNFGGQSSFRGGVELALYLPFNKNSWALIFEATYFYYKTSFGEEQTSSSSTLGTGSTTRISGDIDVEYVEIPVGLRYYYPLSDKQKLFVNASYAFTMDMNSLVRLSTLNIELEPAGNFQLGLGYKHNNKYQAELRYGFNKNLTNIDFSRIESNSSFVSLILGYNLF